jgi:iron-sulfur cluster insertion protein
MIVTESAIDRLVELKLEDPDATSETFFRVFVQGGGCSGFQYGFTFDNEKNDDDFEVVSTEKICVLVDSISMSYLQEATVDYKEDLMGASFVINNPTAQSSCGCGSSFSV